MSYILETKNLTFTYGRGTPFEHDALRDVHIGIREGEYVGVIGHTGSGKSTLMQHLNGLLKPTSGQVLLDGKDIHAKGYSLRDVRFRVGLVFQYPEHQLFEETVYRDIAFGPQNMGLAPDEVRARVLEAAGMVGLSETMMEASPFELSGGQKRRVAIAGVMAMRPDVLILDEPTAGLDPQGREQILAQIRAYHEQRGCTVLLVTHSMEDIARAVRRLIVLSDAQVLMDGTPAEVFARADELSAVGLDVPQITRVFMGLRARGVPIDTAVYTVKFGANLLAHMLEGGGGDAS